MARLKHSTVFWSWLELRASIDIFFGLLSPYNVISLRIDVFNVMLLDESRLCYSARLYISRLRPPIRDDWLRSLNDTFNDDWLLRLTLRRSEPFLHCIFFSSLIRRRDWVNCWHHTWHIGNHVGSLLWNATIRITHPTLFSKVTSGGWGSSFFNVARCRPGPLVASSRSSRDGAPPPLSSIGFRTAIARP